MKQNSADKDVDYIENLSVQAQQIPSHLEQRTDTAADEREQERGVARNLRRNLELCMTSRLVSRPSVRTQTSLGAVVPSKAVATNENDY